MPRIKRILIPTDFSPASDIALAYGIDMAVRLETDVHLLHVIDETSFASAYPDGVYLELPSVRERLISEAAAQLDLCMRRCEAAGIATTNAIVVGRPAPAITQCATDRGTDLIVMGTHGRGAFAHFVIGSVAERVVRTAPCAVVTVRDTSRIADALTPVAASQTESAATLGNGAIG